MTLPTHRPFWRVLLHRAGVALLITVALFVFAWTGRIDVESQRDGEVRRQRVALFVNGTLGDKSFFDAAARGLARGARELGLHTRVVEGGHDPTRWEPALADLVDSGDFDLVITGTFAMVGSVQRLAARHPHARFVVFDAAVDPAQCGCSNVHSITFRPREAAFLAGHAAARLAAPAGAASSAPLLGAVGGLPVPVVDDFINGFEAGARHADPRARVMRQYVNSFSDPATAKDIAKAMYAQGSGAVFQVAGGSGQGVVEAAAEARRWVVGVDSDQYLMYRESAPARAEFILTSVLKHVDVAIFGTLKQLAQHELRYGAVSSLGLAEGGVSLANSAPAWQALPAPLKAELQGLQQDIAAGRLVVAARPNAGTAP